MAEPITTALLAATLAAKTFDEIASGLSKAFVSGVAETISRQYERATLNFRPHLKATYDRCTKIKTILKKDEPIDLLSHYVDLRFRCGDHSYKNDAAIEEIRRRKKVLVFGTAGTGKTVFMRYLWLSFFYMHDGKIPIFIELRKLNDLTTLNLTAYVQAAFKSAGSDISGDLVDEFIRKGKLVFMFDGFDEVNSDKKTLLETQILDLANSNPNCTIVVSSRPSERLSAWQLFSVFDVLPLEKAQVSELIGKIHYEPEIKAKFLKKLDKDLYDRHQSFLSSPLLATMMLMTFDQFLDIPQKVYIFYRQAFETLFVRHDAVKEAFQRQMYTDLSMDDFARYFSNFCLVTYYEQKIEFVPDEVNAYLKKALAIDAAKINIEAFLKDLVESVCIMQKEGLHYVFSHRSFQEYFAAYCIARLPPQKVGSILQKISVRGSDDDVIPMLFDMDTELVEQGFVLPFLEKIVPPIKGLKGDQLIPGFLDLMGVQIRITQLIHNGMRTYACFFEDVGEDFRRLNLLRQLYPSRMRISRSTFIRGNDDLILGNMFQADEASIGNGAVKRVLAPRLLVTLKDGKSSYSRGRFVGGDSETGSELLTVPPEIVEQLGLVKYLRELAELVPKLHSYVLRTRKKKADTLDEIFELA